ncbi:MAG: alpha/beta hydrolase [Proteobacteria bacterium]|nr:alpha/beta hydrolase [Pseudomonadota bacterium]
MEIELERYGTGEKVLFIHGAGGSTKTWFYQMEYLKTSVEVMLIDLPGHGRAGDSDGCTAIDEHKDSVYRALKSSGIDRCYMVGHSMGGAIAMSCALSFPDMVKGIVLMGTGARLRVFPEILEGIMKDKEKTLRSIIEFAISKNAPDLLKKGCFDEMMKCRPEVVYNDFYACDHFNAMNTLNTINTPALIICGTNDALTPPKYSRYLHENIRGSELVLIKDAGHMVMLEKPEEVNKAILKFITKRNRVGSSRFTVHSSR